jgi:5'-3' exoribonuclease 1
MYYVNSPILDFYPLDFEQDLNGKKQDWEAVVKIPFIDEQRLLKAMAGKSWLSFCFVFHIQFEKGREHRLTEEEKTRNAFGTSLKFRYNPDETTHYPSSLPGFFPPIARCACIVEPFDLPTLDGLHLIPGLCDGVALGVEALAGFPSLKTLPHTASVGYHGVNVHGVASRNKSMIIHIENPYEDQKMEELAARMIGKRTFMGWPFLQEGKVVSISDALFKYEKLAVTPGSLPRVVSTQHTSQGLSHWKTKVERIENHYSKRCGVITGMIEVVLHIRPLKGIFFLAYLRLIANVGIQVLSA